MTKHAIRKKSQNRSSARVVDGKLILSFPDALTPVLWQMDLNEAKASAMIVRGNDNDGSSSLALKTAKGESLSIADFADKEEAVQGLMAVSRALENAHGQIRPPLHAANEYENKPILATYRHKKRNGFKWAFAILAAIIILVMITIWGSMLPRTPDNMSAVASAPVSVKDAAGVPVSADDYLKDFQEH